MPLIDRQFSAAGNFVQMDSIALQKQKKNKIYLHPYVRVELFRPLRVHERSTCLICHITVKELNFSVMQVL